METEERLHAQLEDVVNLSLDKALDTGGLGAVTQCSGSQPVLVVLAAGQGDFFQVYIDTAKLKVEDVKEFLRCAYYRRFEIKPISEFVELHPGGGAAGIRLNRFDNLPRLIDALG